MLFLNQCILTSMIDVINDRPSCYLELTFCVGSSPCLLSASTFKGFWSARRSVIIFCEDRSPASAAATYDSLSWKHKATDDIFHLI